MTRNTHDLTNDHFGTMPLDFVVPGAISPAQLTANTDNWNPTGLATADSIRLSTNSAHNLTGIVAPSAAKFLYLFNVGTHDLVLLHDATSTAANRFYCPKNIDLTLSADSAVLLVYDPVSSRWRVLGGDAFTPTFFQAKTATPGAASTTVAFTSFWDEEDNSIGAPQTATGLTYSAGTFTCTVKATYAITLQGYLAGGTAGDTYLAFQPSGPDTSVAIKIESGAAADGSGRAQSMTYTVQAGDTFQVTIGGTAGQSPCSTVYLYVTRLA